MPSAEAVSALPALHGGNGPVGGTRGAGVGVADGVPDWLAVGLDALPPGEAEALGVGLVVSEGLGVGAAIAGLEKSANAKVAAAVSAAGILRYLVTN